MPARPPYLLLVDDDGPLIDSLAFAFELEGFRVIAHADAAAALEGGVPDGPGCLIIDLNLPEMDGLELIAAFREQGVEAPAVLITTHPSAAVRLRARDQGAMIVEKPLLTDDLLDAVRGMLA